MPCTPRLGRARVVIIGGGIAGLATALQLAPQPVTVLAKSSLGEEAATPWAQGGIAAGRPAMPIDAPGPAMPDAEDSACVAGIRRLMTDAVGVIRHEYGLEAAIVRLDRMAGDRPQPPRAADLATTGLLIAVAARERRESRGAHYRSDHPRASEARARPIELTLADARERAAALRAEYSVAGGA